MSNRSRHDSRAVRLSAAISDALSVSTSARRGARALACTALVGALTFASGATAAPALAASGLSASGSIALATVLAGAPRAAPQPNRVLPPRDGRGITLRLQHDVFDPLVRPAAIAAELSISAPRGNTDYYLVQFSRPITDEMRAELVAAGMHVLDYVPDFAYIVKASPQSIQTVRSNGTARWAGLYQPAYRLERGLADALPSATAGQTVDVAVRLFQGEVFAKTLQPALAGLGATVLSQTRDSGAGEVLKLRVPQTALRDIAFVPDVAWIEPVYVRALANEVARSDDAMRKDYVEANAGLFGANQGVAVGDTGFSTGNPATVHMDVRGRVLGGNTAPGSSCGGWTDAHSHGTHVVGSVLGNGTMSGSDPANHLYDGSNAGIAPEALLYMWGFCSDFTGLPDGLYENYYSIMRDADPRVRINTNSWGYTAGQGNYNIDSKDSDRFMFDNPDMVLLYAAGNEGVDGNSNGVVDPASTNMPGTAKNVITVGASENFRLTGGYNPGGPCDAWGDCWPADYPVNPIRDDPPSNNVNGMVAFSSRGPVNDGRLKPDVVAPGSNILSTRGGSGTGWGAFDANYIYNGGTSMATPLVAGAAAVIREFYQVNRDVASPSGALIKATLINGAFDMSPGQYPAGPTQDVTRRPDINQGWGRVDLQRSAMYEGARGLWFHEATPGLATGAVYTTTIEVLDGAVPLRTSLVWSDKDGLEATFGALVNDLDLVIESPSGTLYYGNDNLDGLIDADLDRVNPLEGIDVAAPETGTWTFTVTGFNVPSGPQPFALVVSGGIPKPPFRVVAEPGTLEVCAATDAVFDVDAVLDVVSFTDPVTLSASGVPAGTTATFSANNQPAPFSSTLTIGDTEAATPGDYTILIDGTSGAESAQTSVNLGIVGAAPVAFAPISPFDGAAGVPLLPTLYWSASSEVDEYLVEVATDAAFTNIVFSDTVAGTSVTVPALAGTTEYFWRVSASNICGPAPAGPVFSFNTVETASAQLCNTATTAIPDNVPAGVTTQITFPAGSGTAIDLDLEFRATHTWTNDLIVKLTKVAGPTSTPLSRPTAPGGASCNSNNPDLILDDEGTLGPAQTSCVTGTNNISYTVGGRYTPNQALSAFDGVQLDGVWELNVSDNAGIDTGSVTRWCVSATTGGGDVELTAAPDAYTGTEDTLLTVDAAAGVLANDTTTGTDPLNNATVVVAPASGTLVLAADGSFTFQPEANVCGAVTFQYVASDGTGVSNAATVSIDVACVADTPVAVDDSYSTPEGETLTVVAPGVLGNDTLGDGTALTATLVTGPADGTLTLNPNGSFEYVPTDGTCGIDTFTYTANDGVDSNTATVSIDVECAGPVAGEIDDLRVVVGTPVDVPAGEAFTDAGGDALTFSATGLPAFLEIDPATGDITGTPGEADIGVYTIEVTATDPDSNTASASFTLTVVGEGIFGDGFEAIELP